MSKDQPTIKIKQALQHFSEIKTLRVSILSILLFIALASSTLALVDVDIDTKSMFAPGDVVFFEYTLTSELDITVDIIPSVTCENTPGMLLDIKSIVLTANKPHTERYDYVELAEDTNIQQCRAHVEIISPFVKTYSSVFEIGEIFPKEVIQFSVRTCSDNLCKKETRTFAKGDDVFIRYSSNIKDINVDAIIKKPSDQETHLSLPGKITVTDLGTYTITAAANKEGSIPTSRTVRFGVIENTQELITITTCDKDTLCEDGENYQNCPTDCVSGSKDSYCDMLIDGICDPDCDEDRDCLSADNQKIQTIASIEEERGEQPRIITPKDGKSKKIWTKLLGLLIALFVAVLLWKTIKPGKSRGIKHQ